MINFTLFEAFRLTPLRHPLVQPDRVWSRDRGPPALPFPLGFFYFHPPWYLDIPYFALDNDAKTITDDIETDEQVCQLVEQLQNRFNTRIVQIQGINGGLLVVLNQLNLADEEFVHTLSNVVPVTLISITTLTGLQHLGMVTSLMDTPNTTILYENKAYVYSGIQQIGFVLHK